MRNFVITPGLCHVTLQMSCTVAETESFLLPQKFNLLFERSFHVSNLLTSLYFICCMYFILFIWLLTVEGHLFSQVWEDHQAVTLSFSSVREYLAIFHWQYWTAKKAMAFGNIVAFICVISFVSDSVALNAIFTKSPVDSNSAKKMSLRFKKSFKNPKLTGTWRKVILGISGKTWRGKTATDRHDCQTRTSH